ncbi:hypothetical protein ACODT5_22045 [Streptomyces sp. 5.8]|uniref:hypothetical protein n=1 Tax=Streptomyces sp. 5.8 TaxID=3406571 RepID=UPI003BB816BF
MPIHDKVWVTAPGQEPWEACIVKPDADTVGKSATTTGDACCAIQSATTGAAELRGPQGAPWQLIPLRPA